jgi:hypothetical protein
LIFLALHSALSSDYLKALVFLKFPHKCWGCLKVLSLSDENLYSTPNTTQLHSKQGCPLLVNQLRKNVDCGNQQQSVNKKKFTSALYKVKPPLQYDSASHTGHCQFSCSEHIYFCVFLNSPNLSLLASDHTLFSVCIG